MAFTLTACGDDSPKGSSGGAAGATATGEVVDLGGGASIRYPGEAPKGATTARPAAPAPASAAKAADGGAPAPSPWRPSLERALAAGRSRAEALGGTAEAAIWVSGWSQPVVTGDATRRSRLWSMFKPVAALAAMQAASEAGKPGGSAVTRAAIELALRRSDNCAARRVVLSLQQLLGGAAAAAARVRAILDAAGANARVATQTGPADAACRAYLQASTNLRDPLAPGVQLGTSTWGVRDAVAFAHALVGGTYGSDGRQVRAWMKESKSRAAQVPAEQYTVSDPEWGAGVALADRRPAFKGGWGGTQQGAFVVGQIAMFTVGASRVAMAVYFHPGKQPAIDDPGLTNAPAALQAMFASIDQAFTTLTG